MSPEIFVLAADRVGVFVFALSGGAAAVRRDMDLFGVLVLAFLPAVGGGTIRDLILAQPVFWLDDPVTMSLATAGAFAAFFLHRFVESFRPLRWADAVGLAVFSVTGAAKASLLGHNVFVVLIMGTMTASAGGLLRDVVANQEPLLLKEDIYATAAFSGSLVYFVMNGPWFDERLAFFMGLIVALALRGAAIRFRWSLPKPPGR